MKHFVAIAGLATAALYAGPVSAQVTFFGSVAPTGNYSAFLSSLSSLGAPAQTITFNDQLAGAFNPAFFPGVTFVPVGVFSIRNDAGPADGNTSTPPLSTGEGAHAPSAYLNDATAPSSLAISFANPTSGAGLFLVDFFNPTGDNHVTFQAFTGMNGTGTSLGSFSALSFNFQNNNEYFLGFTSAAGNIGSVVLTRVSDITGDDFGIDDVTFGRAAVQVTPEPATLTLMATGLVGLGGFVRRRKKSERAAA